jgi:hypothetical protein
MPTKKKGTTHRVETGGTVSARSGDTGDGEAIAAPTSPEECEELHQVSAYLAAKYEGVIERTKGKRSEKGKAGKTDRVTMRLTYGEDSEVVTGVGANNREALQALTEKLGESGFACFSDEEDAQ